MIRLPQPPRSLGDVMRCLRELIDCLSDWQPVPSPNTLLTQGSRGTGRQAIGGGDGGGSGGTLQIRGQWDVAESYEKDELVFCDSVPEREDGTQAGLYQALNDVTGGGHPSTNTTDWRMVARGHWGRIVYRVPSSTAGVVIEAGQDIAYPKIGIYAELGSSTNAIELSIEDLNLLGGGLCKLYRDSFCVGAAGVKETTWLRTPFV